MGFPIITIDTTNWTEEDEATLVDELESVAESLSDEAREAVLEAIGR